MGPRERLGSVIFYVDADTVLAHAQHIALAQGVEPAAALRRDGIVDEHAVGAGVFEEVAALARMEAGMMAGQIALGIRQRPVVVKRASDAAA